MSVYGKDRYFKVRVRGRNVGAEIIEIVGKPNMRLTKPRSMGLKMGSPINGRTNM